MSMYQPEGMHWEVKELDIDKIKKAMETGEILEGKVLKSDEDLNIYVELSSNLVGLIPYNEIEYSALGNKPKSVAIMSKVGKCIKFKVSDVKEDTDGNISVICSRAAAQKDCHDNYIKKLTPGDIVKARVTHIENYGLFCDIGCGLVALLPIENVSIARIVNPKKSLRAWKDLYAVIKFIGPDGKITLTHKELLGTWEEEVAKFKVGETVPGVVKTIENYGVFVQISQNLSGLAENEKNVSIDDNVNVYIKDINPEHMKVKLAIVSSDTPDPDYVNKIKFKYNQKHGHIDEWVYSPKNASRIIKTNFSI